MALYLYLLARTITWFIFSRGTMGTPVKPRGCGLALAFLETMQAEFPHLSRVLAAARHPDFRALYALLENARTAPDNPSP